MKDPYLAVIRAFNKEKVAYIVIGVSGINYYADDALNIIMTGDYDIFLKPIVENLRRAISVMKSLDYAILVRGRIVEEFTKEAIAGLVRKKSTLVCENPDHNLIELCLEISGYFFEELEKNANPLKAGKETIKVGDLKDLLRSKKIAGRPKDRIFLEKYSQLLDDKNCK